MVAMFTHLSVSHLEWRRGPEPRGGPATDPPVPSGRGLRTDERALSHRAHLPRRQLQPLLTRRGSTGRAVREGDYLLSDGTPVTAAVALRLLRGKGREPVEITTGPNRTERRPARGDLLQGENTLRRMAWAEENRRA